MDSTVLVYDLIHRGFEVHALSVNYGQRHKTELSYAARTARKLKIDWRIVDFSPLGSLLKGSALTDAIDVPEGHYAADNMAITVVPNRNAILLSIATGWAVSLGAEVVAFAAHAGDHAQYPDCRMDFVNQLGQALYLGNEGFIHEQFRIEAPYVGITKAQIAKIGEYRGVPFEDTWSCYKGTLIHCGKCGTCIERAEAFAEAGVSDPTPYADAEYWKQAVTEFKQRAQ
jgi:7-cyano-7-deazaguanine synthase